jgi:hypothetical protein
VAHNFLVDVVEQLGGVVKTAGTAGTAVETIHLAMRKGKLTHAAAVVRLVLALAPDDPAEQMRLARRLTGVPD